MNSTNIFKLSQWTLPNNTFNNLISSFFAIFYQFHNSTILQHFVLRTFLENKIWKVYFLSFSLLLSFSDSQYIFLKKTLKKKKKTIAFIVVEIVYSSKLVFSVQQVRQKYLPLMNLGKWQVLMSYYFFSWLVCIGFMVYYGSPMARETGVQSQVESYQRL